MNWLVKFEQEDGTVYVDVLEVLYVKGSHRPVTSLLLYNEDRYKGTSIIFKNGSSIRVTNTLDEVLAKLNPSEDSE